MGNCLRRDSGDDKYHLNPSPNKPTISTISRKDTTIVADVDEPLISGGLESSGKRHLLSQRSDDDNDKLMSREESLHLLSRYTFQADFLSPVEEKLKTNSRVLDLGCGEGSWVLDIAHAYPWANVFGIDTLSTFPSEKPLNATFFRHNILDGFPFNEFTFDFVHVRCMASVFTESEWHNKVLNELVRITKPDGYIELAEIDGCLINEGPATARLTKSRQEYMKSQGMNSVPCTHLAAFLSSNDRLHDVQEREERPPIGSWDSRAGLIALQGFTQELRELRDSLSTYMGLSADEYDNAIDELCKEVNVSQTRMRFTRVFARRKVLRPC